MRFESQAFVEKAASKIAAFFGNPKNRIGLIIIAALFVPLAGYALIELVRFGFGAKFGDGLFFNPNDRFADLIKSGLSYRSITGGITHAQLEHWPAIFQDYYSNNPYLGPLHSRFHAPPFAALTLQVAALISVAINPTMACWSYFATYLLLVIVVLCMLRRCWDVSGMDVMGAAYALLLSYPILFMYMRGNFGAGLTTLFLAIYILTVMKGQGRWLGFLCLALAVNLRPNTAAFGLLELVGDRRYGHMFLSVMAVGVLTAAIAAASYSVAHHLDPEYTLDKFLTGLSMYSEYYSVEDAGYGWNFSLFGFTKRVRELFHLQPLYSPLCYMFVSGLGVAAVVAMVYLALKRRLTYVEAAFLATSFSVLFTPVLAFYHMGNYAAPLLGLLAEKGRKTAVARRHWLIFALVLSCLCPISAKNNYYAPLILAVMVVTMADAYRRRGKTQAL